MKKGNEMPSLNEGVWINSYCHFSSKPTLVLFWSMSCSECASLLNRCQREQWANQDAFHFVSVHLARSAEEMDIQPLTSFCKSRELTFPVVFDGDFSIADSFDVQLVPTIYVFDANSRFVQYFRSSVTLREILRNLNQYK